MNDKIGQDKGFTLVELIVVVVISSTLFGVGIAAYNTFNRRQTIVQTAGQIKDYLRQAQSKSLAGEKDCTNGVCGTVVGQTACVTGSKTLDGWFIDFSNNTIYGRCQGTVFGSIPMQLPYQVTISSSPTAVQFSPLSSGSTPAVICLSKFSYNYKISVSLFGEIKDEGFVANCP